MFDIIWSMELSENLSNPERGESRKAYVFNRLEGIKALSIKIPEIDEETLLRIPVVGGRAGLFVKSKDEKKVQSVREQLRVKGETDVDEAIILESVFPVQANLLKRAGYKEKKIDTPTQLDQI